MKLQFASLLAATSLFSTSVLAHPRASPFDTISFSQDAQDELHKRASTFPIKGAVGIGDGALHTRLEINTLASKPLAWSLFILTMQKFHAIDQSNLTGYYQIAGIHGVPRQNWDNVAQCSSCGDADGYCPHDSVLFPGWHRVYMALFEQEFLKIAYDVAMTFPAGTSRNNMLAAQKTMRFPYWDWAAAPANGGPTIPTTITNPTVTVTGPSGSTTIPNPLYRHTFADPSNLYYGTFNSWKNTLRWPNSNSASATNQDSSLIAAMNNVRSSLKDQVYQLMSTCADFLHFSNDAAGSSSTSCSTSLESIHNTVHTTVGGPGSSNVLSGHMTYLSLASFDPVFWLHHMNVDRLFAMWQTINPNSYGASQTAPHSSWTIASGSTQGADSPLTPFHKDTSGTFWTTNMVKDWAGTFKYTYPEYTNTKGDKAAIVSVVNKLYGPSATATAGSVKRSVASEPDLDDTPSTAVSGIASIATGTSAFPSLPTNSAPYTNSSSDPLTANNGSSYQYVCNVQTPRFALNGSYTVYIFNGAPACEDANTWMTDSNLIGPVGVLAGGDMTDPTLLITGSIPLTRVLQDMVYSDNLKDMSEKSCIPYLTEHLTWRVGQGDQAIDVSNIPNFQVSVFSSTTTPMGEYTLPEWSAFIPQVQITKEKTGGAQIADYGSSVGVSAPGSYSSSSGSSSSSSSSVSVSAPDSYSSPSVSSASAASPDAYTHTYTTTVAEATVTVTAHKTETVYAQQTTTVYAKETTIVYECVETTVASY